MTELNTATFRRYGKEWSNPPEPLTILVERRDVTRSTIRDSNQCALAQCLRRQDGVARVSVGATFVYVEFDDERRYRYILSTEDRRMVRVYDETNYLRPGEYTLLVPPPAAQIGARKGTKAGSETRKGKTRTALNKPALRHQTKPR